MGERVRVTVAVEPDVLEVFKTMSAASGISVSRCMGDWLADTADGAQFVALKMKEARESPMTVMREMQAMALGVSDEVSGTVERLRTTSARASRAAQPHGAPGGVAPSSNTGLKGPGSASGRTVLKGAAASKRRAAS